MKPCPECATICHAAARKCRDCGYDFPVNEKELVGEVYKGKVLSEPEIREVVKVTYTPHNLGKEEKTPSLRVRYDHPDNTYTCEYICLQHSGFAYQKAMKWWNERDGGAINGATVEQICKEKYPDELKTPQSITVRKEGKWGRIIKYNNLQYPVQLTAKGASTVDLTDDIDFPW